MPDGMRSGATAQRQGTAQRSSTAAGRADPVNKLVQELANYLHEHSAEGNAKLGAEHMEYVNEICENLADVLEDGEDPNLEATPGWPPLRKCCRLGILDMARVLVERGRADVNANNAAALTTAASWGHSDVVRFLLEQKADLQLCDERAALGEDTPLMWAVRNGHQDVAGLLIEHKADVNASLVKGGNHAGPKVTALRVAWEHSQVALVEALIKEGAELVENDWYTASASPVLAMHVASGLRFRYREAYDELGRKAADRNPRANTIISVPLKAVCQWIEDAPKAAAVLVSDVLARDPQPRPARAELRLGEQQRICYVPLDQFTRREKELDNLCPKDNGAGVLVDVHVVDIPDMITCDLLFSLTAAGSGGVKLYHSTVILGLISHFWTDYVRLRYFYDLAREVSLMGCLLAWTVMLPDPPPALTYVACALLILTVLIEVREEGRQLWYQQSRRGNWKDYFDDPWNIVDWLRISSGIMFVCIYLTTEGDMMDMAQFSALDDNIRPIDDLLGAAELELQKVTRQVPTYTWSMAIAVFFRWLKVLFYLRGFELFGPQILPILLSLRDIGPFTMVLLMQLTAFVHASYVLNFFRVELDVVFIREYELLFADLLGKYDAQSEAYNGWQVFWFVFGAFFLGVVMLNVFIGVLAETYDRQQDSAQSTFQMERASICFMYSMRIPYVNEVVTETGVDASTDSQVRALWNRWVNDSFVYRHMFPRPPQQGRLWLCSRDQTENSEALGVVWEGRLQAIKKHTELVLDVHSSAQTTRIFDRQKEEIDTWVSRLDNRVTALHQAVTSGEMKINELLQPLDNEDLSASMQLGSMGIGPVLRNMKDD